MEANGQNLGRCERGGEDKWRAEVRRLESQLHDISVECKKALQAAVYGDTGNELEIVEQYLRRVLHITQGAAT